jgi:uncharacterized protein (TIGR00369 family)
MPTPPPPSADTIPPPAVLQELERRWNEHPGIRRMGVKLDLTSTPGRVRASIDPVEPHHRGGMGTSAVNGPTIAALFDLVTGLTAYLSAVGKRVGVAQLNIQFLRPVKGDRLHAIGTTTRAGRSLSFVSAELFDQADTLCARADGLVSISASEGTGELAL